MTSPGRDGDKLPRPRRARGHWTSFIAEPEPEPDGRVVRGLHEEANAHHRLRVEHDAHTLLIHLSGEDGKGWMTIAVDRTTRRSAVGQAARQSDAARDAYERLYRP
ncbi:MAG: hypothetical protein M3065_20875 [Actinomycetota bacterium]|nr:hypothetical protein [Actinomycetota bacterium]